MLFQVQQMQNVERSRDDNSSWSKKDNSCKVFAMLRPELFKNVQVWSTAERYVEMDHVDMKLTCTNANLVQNNPWQL